MQRHLLALLLVSGCGAPATSSEPISARPRASSAITAAADLPFVVPALAPDTSHRVELRPREGAPGVLFIDGVDTGWVGAEVPELHRIDEDRVFIAPRDIWSTRERSRTTMGEDTRAVRAPGLGWLFVESGYDAHGYGPDAILDLDPITSGLRVLYAGATPFPVSRFRDALLVEDEGVLSLVRPGRATEPLSVALGAWRLVEDPLRGERLLLIRSDARLVEAIHPVPPPTVEAAIMDLTTGTLRTLGTYEGCAYLLPMNSSWVSMHTDLRWAGPADPGSRDSSSLTGDALRSAYWASGICLHEVRPDDETLVAVPNPE